MIGWLLKRGIAVAFLWLLRRYKRISLGLLKIQAAMYYVKGIQAARSGAVCAVCAAGLIALMGAGFVLLPAGLAVLLYGLSGSWVASCVVLLALGAVYLIVSLLALRRCLSERAWMRFFKVDELVAKVTERPED